MRKNKSKCKSQMLRVKNLFRHPAKWVMALLACGLCVASMTRADGSKKPTLESIGDQVMCLCGCVATLNHCPHRDCATVAEIRPIIEKEIAEGKDETTILQDLAIRYGVQVLAAPTAKGFSLAAWILPGIGLLAGLSFVVIMVRRWRKPSPVAAAIPAKPLDPKLLTAVEEEMKASGLGVRDQ
jgi:cytochrome c-type biogenesis protein CcmH/NrfF